MVHPGVFTSKGLWVFGAGPALIVAAWPADGLAVDQQALEHFEAMQAAVRGIRNARAEYGVTLGRKIAATVVIPHDSALRFA